MTGWWLRARGPQLEPVSRRLLVGAALAIALGACGASAHKAAPPPGTATTVPASSSTTTKKAPGPQTRGPRTVLSPIGLNVHSGPAKSARVIGAASQGTLLKVLGNNGRGWLRVKGATVTGWISDLATLSAPGRFHTYTSPSNAFGALYPVGWTYVAPTPAHVVFRAKPGPDTIVVSSAAKAASLPHVGAAYHQIRSEQIVVCGVTSQLVTYKTTGRPSAARTGGTTLQIYLAQVLLTLDARHALGMNANITNLSALQTVRNFANSVTFPFPQCEG